MSISPGLHLVFLRGHLFIQAKIEFQCQENVSDDWLPPHLETECVIFLIHSSLTKVAFFCPPYP